MFKTRLISGAVLVVLALIFLIWGGYPLLILLGLLSLIGLYELYRVFGIERSAPGILGYVISLIYYFDLAFHFVPSVTLLLMGAVIAFMCVFVFTYPKHKIGQITGAFFGVFYVSVMLSCIYQTRILEGGVWLVWLIFFCSWGCDTCAYCVGMRHGKRKMSPKLSPKKSVEGAIGGVIGAAVIALIYGIIFFRLMGVSSAYIFVMAGICAAGALLSMVGDLAASAIKRNYDIKDYGKLIPGHGGILDRFDSVIFTAPVIFFLSLYFLAG